MWGDLIIGAANGILNYGINSLLGNQAREHNYYLGEKAADNADARQRAQFYDMYSIPAQMKQLQEAGLSPSMFAGHLGAGSGATGAQGGGGGGIGNGSGRIFDLGLLSQIKLNEAKANEANANAEDKRGETPTSQAEITNKLAQAGYYKQGAALAKSQSELNDLDYYVKQNTADFNIEEYKFLAKKAQYEAAKTFAEMRKMQIEANYADDEIIARINNIIQDTELKFFEKNLAIANAELSWEQCRKVASEANYVYEYYKLEFAKVENEILATNDKRKYFQAIEKYQNDMIKMLEERLDFDKSKWSEEQKILWTQTIGSLVNQMMATYMQAASMAIGAMVKM